MIADNESTGGRRSNSTAADEEPALLPQTLPSSVALNLSGFLIAVAFIAFIIIVFVPFPESVKSPFTVVSPQGAVPIKVPRDGIVEQVLVTDGDRVNANQALFVLRSSELRDLATKRTSLQLEIESDKAQLAKLRIEAIAHRLTDQNAIEELQAWRAVIADTNQSGSFGPSNPDQSISSQYGVTAEFDASGISELLAQDHRNKLAVALRRVAELSERLPLVAQQQATALELLKTLEIAAGQGQTPKRDVLQQRFVYEQTQLDLKRIPEQLEEAKQELQTLITERALAIKSEILAAATREADINRLQTAIKLAELRLAALDRELVNVTDDQLKILAPESGFVIDLEIRQPGVVVERSDILCQVQPEGAKLLAELHVPEEEVGLLTRGQKVRLLFSAFPYTRFDTRDARLHWISPVGKAGTFRALAALNNPDKATVFLVNGEQRRIKVGMQGEARITVGRRTPLEYIFEPLRQLRESVGLTSGSI